MQKVRVGVVGAGRLGGFHAAKISAHAEAELTAVYDPMAESRERLAGQFGAKSCVTVEEMLPLVDAAVIAAPSTLHDELGVLFLENGSHLLIEKPLATTARGAGRLVEIARQKRLVLQAGHVEQYNPAWIAAAETLSEMKAAGPIEIESHRTSGYTFRCVDIGATLDLMVHDLELTLSLVDAPVTRIIASGFREFGGHEDTVGATLEFENGSTARLFASRVELSARRKMTVRSARKRAIFDFAARTAEIVTPSPEILGGTFSPERIDSPRAIENLPDFMRNYYSVLRFENAPFDALSLEMDDFISAILRRTAPRASGERAAEAVALAEQILQAIS